jgi:hypothetical protein
MGAHMTKLTLQTRIADTKVRAAGTGKYYMPKHATAKVKREVGLIMQPVSLVKKHEQALLWVADNAAELITAHNIEPARAILSFASQAESKFCFTWGLGPQEWHRIAAGGVDLVRTKAKDAKFLRGICDGD